MIRSHTLFYKIFVKKLVIFFTFFTADPALSFLLKDLLFLPLEEEDFDWDGEAAFPLGVVFNLLFFFTKLAFPATIGLTRLFPMELNGIS